MTKVPQVIDNLFSDEDYNNLYNHLFGIDKSSEWIKSEKEYLIHEEDWGRQVFRDDHLQEYGEKLVPLARKIFNSETLLMSYSLFCHYEGENPQLPKHKDTNACTYTIDMCLYQTEPWDLYVDGTPYTLHPNQGLAFWGEEQEHWREKYPNPAEQKVGMIFFHFVEPDHWFFTEQTSDE